MAPVKTNIEQALETMKASGLKYTKKRELLMSYLIKRNRYVSAREVYEFMNETFKGVSYDTVYRNLHDFERLELLEMASKSFASVVAKRWNIIITLFVRFVAKRKKFTCVR